MVWKKSELRSQERSKIRAATIIAINLSADYFSINGSIVHSENADHNILKHKVMSANVLVCWQTKIPKYLALPTRNQHIFSFFFFFLKNLDDQNSGR